jgi:hypothetical protein
MLLSACLLSGLKASPLIGKNASTFLPIITTKDVSGIAEHYISAIGASSLRGLLISSPVEPMVITRCTSPSSSLSLPPLIAQNSPSSPPLLLLFLQNQEVVTLSARRTHHDIVFIIYHIYRQCLQYISDYWSRCYIRSDIVEDWPADGDRWIDESSLL